MKYQKKQSDLEKSVKKQLPKMWLLKTSITFSKEFPAIKKVQKSRGIQSEQRFPK